MDIAEHSGQSRIEISLSRQQLALVRADGSRWICPVSTAAKGPGEARDSGCTPRGRHRIRMKIGAGCPVNAVFVGRRFTGEIFTPELAAGQPGRDWILTRILWLSGAESGRNRGGRCDTLRRFIYIHATADEAALGVPVSHGCVRMRNDDILRLFDAVDAGTVVDILE